MERIRNLPQIGRICMELDQYYTTAPAVEKCLETVNEEDYDTVLEPCAGNGAFLSALKHGNIIALDIAPATPGISQCDFLEYELPADTGRVLAIGNPPFGIRHSLSDAFLRKCFSMPEISTIAFILPNTYNKPTRQRLIPPDWRIASITELEPYAFTYRGEKRNLPSSFFVLDKSPGLDLRFDESLYADVDDFRFSNADDFDIFVFGANPGKTTRNPALNNRGHYLKSRLPADELEDRFRSIDWHGNSCASGGVAWFSKPEIVKHYMDEFGS